MLNTVTIRNFKSYKNATIPLSPLTVLIGANCSGKSNAIESLRLASLFAQGVNLDELNKQFGKGGISRGIGAELYYDTSQPIEICCDVAGSQKTFSIPPLNAKQHYSHDSNEIRAGLFFFSDHATVASESLIHISFLDAHPCEMRDYTQKSNRALATNASNLSAVLYSLCKTPDTKAYLLSFLKNLPEQAITDIRFVVTPRDEVMVRLVETFGGKERITDADLLSNGTLRVLALGAFLLSVPEDSVAVVEEMDNAIHPSRAEMLVAQMLAIASRRKLRILLTSYNPALLDALPHASLPDVVCCYRDTEEGDSRLMRLGDMCKYPELVAQGTLGGLVTRQILDRYLHDTNTPEQEKANALAWLKNLSDGVNAPH